MNEEKKIDNAETANENMACNLVLSDELPLDAKKFIIWLITRDEWHYDSTENLFRQDGYRSRTTDELYKYYRTKGQFFR